jgi:hypothetical protein
MTHLDDVPIPRKDRADVKQNPNQEILFLDDFVSSLKEGKLVTSASRKYPSFTKLFITDKNAIKPSFEDLFKILSDTNKVYLMVAAQKLEQTLNSYALKGGEMRANGLSQYLDLMKDYVTQNANVAGTFIRCILLSAFFINASNGNDLIKIGRWLIHEFNADTIESLNRIIVPYLNRQANEEQDALSNHHLTQLMHAIKDMYYYITIDEVSPNQENILRFFSAMLNTLAKNLRLGAGLSYLRLLYEAADFILTNDDLPFDPQPLPKGFHSAILEMYNIECTKCEDKTSPKLELLLRIMSVTPDPTYNQIEFKLQGSIKDDPKLVHEKEAWESVTFAALGGDASEKMEKGLANVVSTVQSDGYKDTILIALFGYLEPLSVLGKSSDQVLQFLSSEWVTRYHESPVYGTLCLRAALDIVEHMTISGYQNEKLPQLLFDIIVHPNANHKSTALRVICGQTIADDLVQKVCDYIAKHDSEEVILVMKVLESIIQKGANKVVQDSAVVLLSHLFAIMSDTRSMLAHSALNLIEQLVKYNNIQNISDLGDDMMEIFGKALLTEEGLREKQAPTKPLPLENLSVLTNDSKTLLSCLQELTIGSDTFLKLFTKLAVSTTKYEGIPLVENVFTSITKKRQVTPLQKKLTQQRLSTIRKSMTSTTSFGVSNLPEDTEKQAPRITINRRNSKIDTENSIFNSEYSNYFWSERGFFNSGRKLYQEVAQLMEMRYKLERESLFQFYDSPVNAFLQSDQIENNDDEFVLSSDDDDDLSELTDDSTSKPTQKLVSDMEGTLFSCHDFYRLVFNDELETHDAYGEVTGEINQNKLPTNLWFLAGPPADYVPTRHILSALVAARILLAKKQAKTLAAVPLLEVLYKICAMFQFLSLRVNLLVILIMNDLEMEGETVIDITCQILQQMNTALRSRFQFKEGEKNVPLTQPERTFLYHYTQMWLTVITKLRFATFFKARLENCDENAMILINQICRTKLLSVLLPLPDLAILIRVLHYSSSVQEKETNSTEYTLFGRERHQVYTVFPNDAFESVIKENSKEATYHQINSNLISIIAEYIVLDHFNLYNILDFIVRMEVNTTPLRASLFQGILDLQSHLKERNDLEQIVRDTIVVFENGVGPKGRALVLLTETGVTIYDTDQTNKFVLKDSVQKAYADLKIEYQRFTSAVKIGDIVIPNGRKVLEVLRKRCHESQFSQDKLALAALEDDIPLFGSRVTATTGEEQILYVSENFVYLVDPNSNQILQKSDKKNVKIGSEMDSPYGVVIKMDKESGIVFPSDRSKFEFESLMQ